MSSGLIDPNTGFRMPTQKEKEQAQVADAINRIVGAINTLVKKHEALLQQQVHLGLYVEYLSTKLLELTKQDGTPLLPVDMDQFPKWAEARLEEMREQARQAMEAEATASAPPPADAPVTIDLSDEG